MYDFIDILCMLCGAYLLYTGVVMKVQGRIISNVVLRKNTNEDSIRDKEGFIQYLYWKLAVIGIVIILSSIASLFSGSMGDSNVVSTLTWAVFLAAIIAYAAVVNKAMKKYCK